MWLNSLKTYGPYILIIVLSAILFSKDDTSYIDDYENKIKELQIIVDSKDKEIKGFKNEITVLEQKSDSLSQAVESVRQERIKIIKSYEYYLKDILELNDTELERWFSSRYPADSTNTSSSTISSN
jgi:septal ring factor EnvC (AmiA/AmiB activator)